MSDAQELVDSLERRGRIDCEDARVLREALTYTAPQAAQVQQEADVEAVAEVGPGWTLRLVGSTPIAELCRRHPELRIGTKLYTHPAAQAPAVRVASEMANLWSAVMRLDGQSRRDTLVAYRKLEAALGQSKRKEDSKGKA